MFLKRIILSSIMATCIGQAAMAIPAYPHKMVVQQADGSLLTVTLCGDEYGHLALADDGQPLCFNAATGNYEYAIVKSGTIVASGMKAENAVQRSLQAVAFLKSQTRSGIFSTYSKQREAAVAKLSGMRKAQVAQRAAVSPTDMLINNFPSHGVQHSLVILAQFSDCPFTTVGSNPKQFYTDMLNKEGFTYSNGANGSARDFYVASSNGEFRPTFDVVGPVTLPKSYSYYGANLSSRDNAQQLMEFVRDACTLADPLVDYSQYDKDGDGLVDNVFIYFAGYGEADSGKGNTIWPHAADYRSVCKDAGAATSVLKLDGKQIASYTCSNEINGQTKNAQPTGIGTFVHEFGHVLGLADHYDSQATSLGEAFHPGPYDTMASGSYNNNGNTPPTFSAFERACLGWLNFDELTSASSNLNVLPNLEESNKAYRVTVTGTAGKEFFILENRQQKGWDTYLPGHGMLLWHIDYDKNIWASNAVNVDNSHQRIDIVEADNIRTATTRDGDTFPGASNVTSCKLTSWASNTILTLDDIEEKNGNINVMVGGLNLKLNQPAPKVSQITEESALLQWTAVPVAKQYVVNLYKIENGQKKNVSGYIDRAYADPTDVKLTNLSPLTTYQLTMKAERGSYTSDVAEVSFQTTAVPFAKLSPANLTVVSKTTDAFTASWDAVEGASDYEVTLGKLAYAEKVTARGYDFTDQLNGMPELWETNGSFINSTYGKAAPSLRMTKDGTYLQMGYADAIASGIHFWAKASSSASGNLLVQVLDGEDWKTVETLAVDDDMKEGKTYDCPFSNRASTVRLYLEREKGVFYVDDVLLDCHNEEAVTLPAYDAVSTKGSTRYTFSAISEGGKYLLTVVGKKGSEHSLATKLTLQLVGTTGVMGVSADGASDTMKYYDLNGRRLAASQLGHGVYVVKQGDKTYKIVR